MIFGYTNILVLSPHTDDGELGCGGTIARLIQDGAAVHYAAFSTCEASVLPQFPADILSTEVRAATQTLAILPANITVYNYPVRKFPSHRQEILEILVQLNRKIRPDLVFIPSADDVHQDHQVIYQEGVRAFKQTSLLGYELPWNNLRSSANFYLRLEQEHLERKIQAIQCYQSQKHRRYMQPEFITSLAAVRGAQIGVSFAEAFQTIRWIIS